MMHSTDEVTGLIAAFLAALCFGSYGVPMKGEAATRVDVDPLVFQSYKAFTVFATSSILIYINNALSSEYHYDDDIDMTTAADSSHWTFHKWTFSDFTPWAFVSALLWVPGGTAGVYAIRRSGLAVSVGIWSCVIVILSFIWGVLIFKEKQKSRLGAFAAMTVLCLGLCGIAYFSSTEVDEAKGKMKRGGNTGERKQPRQGECDDVVGESAPLIVDEKGENDSSDAASLDFETFPHCGQNPHCHQAVVDLRLPSFGTSINNNNNHSNGKDHTRTTYHLSKYHIGLFMAVVNGVLAASIMVPLHYAPPNATRGIGYSMSFGIAAALVVLLFWMLRFLVRSMDICIRHEGWSELWFVVGGNNEDREQRTIGIPASLQILSRIATESLGGGYWQMPSFHVKEMWRPGLTSGILFSMGSLFGIVGINNLGNFMGYSLSQSSMIISGLWGIFYYREIPGAMNMIGFLASSCIVFVGILLLANEHDV